MLQIGAVLFYYKLGQSLLQIEAASSPQIGASVVASWCSYYKLRQNFSTSQGNYYKLGHNIVQVFVITSSD